MSASDGDKVPAVAICPRVGRAWKLAIDSGKLFPHCMASAAEVTPSRQRGKAKTKRSGGGGGRQFYTPFDLSSLWFLQRLSRFPGNHPLSVGLAVSRNLGFPNATF